MTEAQSVPQPHSDMRARAPQRPFTWPLAVQAAAYVVLIALACLPGSGAVSSSTFSVTAFAVAAIIVLFAFFCPLRDGVPGRVTAVVLGFVAMVCASTPLLGQFVFERQGVPHAGAANAQYTSAAAWCAGVAGLLVVLVVAAFIRQMARPQRTDMIVQLAHMVTDGVVSIAASIGSTRTRCDRIASDGNSLAGSGEVVIKVRAITSYTFGFGSASVPRRRSAA